MSLIVRCSFLQKQFPLCHEEKSKFYCLQPLEFLHFVEVVRNEVGNAVTDHSKQVTELRNR